MNTDVKYFDNFMVGAPHLRETPGALLDVLDGCLVNGFGEVTVTSLSVVSGIGTVVVAGGHGLEMYFRVDVGPVIEVSGANETLVNGQFRVTSVVDIETFTFAAMEVPDVTASGDIKVKRAPAGWSSLDIGDKVRAYRQGGGSRFFLRVDDNHNEHAQVRGYEEMPDGSTVFRPFPELSVQPADELTWARATSPSLRAWSLFASDRFLLYLSEWDDERLGAYEPFLFGDPIHYAANDPYGCIISGKEYSKYWYIGRENPVLTYSLSEERTWWARAFIDQLSPVPVDNLTHHYGVSRDDVYGHTGGNYFDYPNPVDNSIIVRGPIEVGEYGNRLVRGHYPGIYYPYHHWNNMPGVRFGLQGTAQGKQRAFAGFLICGHNHSSVDGAILIDYVNWYS